ncbi:MAG: 23S rRNA (adenine(2030)-N(6))-methyltransferase RlmJ [Alphaproteobacteria bacterium]
MNYQHLYHAGNFADVIKHLILCLCLEKLHEKANTFLAIDTHAGASKYLLEEAYNLNSFEADLGIKNILKRKNFQEILPLSFLKILAKINVCEINELPNKLKYYSGSAQIIKNFLRYNDQAIFAEKSPKVFQELRRNFMGNKKIFCYNVDGFSLAKSKLPPLQGRGLVLIDPAYEKLSAKISLDYQNSINALQEAHKRFAHGIYILWYPIIDDQENILDDFYQQIKQLKFTKILQVIFGLENTDNSINSSTTYHYQILDFVNQNLLKKSLTNSFNSSSLANNYSKMTRCGVFIFNAPYQLEDKITNYLEKICINKS